MLWDFEPFVSPLGRAPAFVPAADVVVSDGDLLLTMDVPGLTQEELSIEFLDGYLVVRGERTRQDIPENANVARRERAFGKFERRLKLPDGVDADAIMASLEHGVLSLIVPKPERLQRRTIAIGSGDTARQLEPTAA